MSSKGELEIEVMKYTTKITLYNSYFDLDENLTIKSILTIFQDIASIHAEEIGVGFSTMFEKHLFWVLSRVKFDILKMPKINQTVIVETWPHEKGKIDFDRDLKILSENGEILIIGTSKWCVIDSEKRTLQKTDNINYVGECLLECNYLGRFNKITLPNKEPKYVFSYNVRLSDLDHNQHMNNTNYANLVFNASERRPYTHFEINYLNECLLNDEIVISTFIDDDLSEYVFGSVNDKNVFVALKK